MTVLFIFVAVELVTLLLLDHATLFFFGLPLEEVLLEKEKEVTKPEKGFYFRGFLYWLLAHAQTTTV